ncbi:tetratricopeptide repeat protein [bacterium]|nr:tetratricopeptide repeat protein [bacterium]MBP9811433.1 tetratricopeptide repeat protein [bacterium]
MVARLLWPTIIFAVCAVNLSMPVVSSYIDDDNPDFARLPIYPLILEGKFEKAITWLDNSITKDPKNLTQIECRAQCYHALKKYPQAIRDFSRCIALSKNNLYLHYDRGQVYSDMGNFEKALEDFEIVIQLAGADKLKLKRFYRLKVNALEHLNRNVEAEIWCSKILAIDHSNFEILSKRASLRRKLKRTQDAISDYSAILKSVPDDAAMLKLRGDAYCEANDWKKAIADFSAAIAEEPELASSIYEARGKAYLKIGDSAKASADMARAKTAKQ